MTESSHAEYRANANAAVREVSDRLYERFRNDLADGLLPAGGIRWTADDDQSKVFGQLRLELTRDRPEVLILMDAVQTLVMNAAFRCHHGPITAQDDETWGFVVSNIAGRWSLPMDVDSQGLQFVQYCVTGLLRLFTSDDLSELRTRIPIQAARYLAGRSFVEIAETELRKVLSDDSSDAVELTMTWDVEDAPPPPAYQLCLNTILASLTDGPAARRKLEDFATHPGVHAAMRQHDFRLAQLRTVDGPQRQALFGDMIRNKPQAQLLLLFGLPEVDWLIPTFDPVRFSSAVAQQLHTAWHVMSSTLHDSELEDFAAAEVNIVKAVENELIETYCKPFFGNHRPAKREPYDRQKLGVLYDLGGRWPDRKPTLGEMTRLLKLAALPETWDLSESAPPPFLRRWVRFLRTQRPATARPSLFQSLEEFARFRNPDFHGGHPPTPRDSAIVLRCRAWCILTHVAQERSDSPLVQRRRHAAEEEWARVPPAWKAEP